MVDKAKDNALTNKIDNCSFYQGDVVDFIEPLTKNGKPGMVVVNPPRTGVRPKAMRLLIQRMVMHMVYISCHPPTLARDIRLLMEAGYTMEEVEGFDMFPQTTHMESVVYLRHKTVEKS